MINQDEIDELKRWLEKSSFLKGSDVYDKVRLLVEKVLKDNILTNDEKMNYLIYLKVLCLNQKWN